MRMSARVSRAHALPNGLVILPAAVAVAAMVLSRVDAAWTMGCWDVAWTAGALAALAGMLLARRAAAPTSRVRWSLWAAAAVFWLVGQLAWDLFGLIGFPASPNLADLGW